MTLSGRIKVKSSSDIYRMRGRPFSMDEEGHSVLEDHSSHETEQSFSPTSKLPNDFEGP